MTQHSLPFFSLLNQAGARLTEWLRELDPAIDLLPWLPTPLVGQLQSRSSSLNSSSVSMPMAAPMSRPSFFWRSFLCRARRSLGSISAANSRWKERLVRKLRLKSIDSYQQVHFGRRHHFIHTFVRRELEVGTEELAKALPTSICREAIFPEWGEKKHWSSPQNLNLQNIK